MSLWGAASPLASSWVASLLLAVLRVAVCWLGIRSTAIPLMPVPLSAARA